MLPPDPAAKFFLDYGPAITGYNWTPVSGGFSGAEVWRGDGATGPALALKAWPPDVTPARLGDIHATVARAAHLPFVPQAVRTATGASLVWDGRRCWDLTHWAPGAATDAPSVAEAAAAGAAVARLHRAWPAEGTGPCPGVANRLRALADFRARLGGAVPPRPPVAEGQIPLVRRAWGLVAACAGRAERALGPWARERVRLSPCVRDLRSEHILFTCGAVTGLIDFGALAIDHPAVDLARYLGDLDGGDRTGAVLGAYRSEAPLDVPDEFVRLLARTGAVCSLVGWLVRLVAERRTSAEEAAVTRRIARLIERVEQFAPE
ncbi:phosphotransferase [Gemmata sp.]|uniref:phosphotransferase n=1 Tax=Gemmata sp. TaxID=1914242 RepID=UPI003F7064AA